jgi:hypothetical protein
MEWLISALCAVIVICVTALAVVLYNFMLLLSELNKRQVYIISDILQSIDLSTPHLDTLSPAEANINVEEILGDAMPEGNYFNPHEYDVDEHKDN